LPRFKPLVQVALGVARDLARESHAASFPLAQPLMIAGAVRTRLGYTHYGFDPALAPAGKSAMMITLPTEYAHWKALAGEQERYTSEKYRVALNVISALEQRFPGITPQIEVIDVATPLTFERYTGNWERSPEGWLVTTKTVDMVPKGMRQTLPGLEHFYMAGHWVEPGGGLPPAAASGRKVIHLICHQEKRRFTTDIPQD
jgi:phytoene dehydrogenase-like protein